MIHTECKLHDSYDCGCVFPKSNDDDEPWQPKYGEVAEFSNDAKEWVTRKFACMHPETKTYLSVYGPTTLSFNYCREIKPNYSTHIEAIKAEAAVFGKTVNVKIEEV